MTNVYTSAQFQNNQFPIFDEEHYSRSVSKSTAASDTIMCEQLAEANAEIYRLKQMLNKRVQMQKLMEDEIMTLKEE